MQNWRPCEFNVRCWIKIDENLFSEKERKKKCVSCESEMESKYKEMVDKWKHNEVSELLSFRQKQKV